MKRDLPEQLLWSDNGMPKSLLASKAVWLAALLGLAFWTLLGWAVH